MRMQITTDMRNAVRQCPLGAVMEGSGSRRLLRVGAENSRVRDWRGWRGHATYGIAVPVLTCTLAQTLLRGLLLVFRQQDTATEAHTLRQCAAGRHFHRAILDRRNLPERIKHGVGQPVSRGFVITE